MSKRIISLLCVIVLLFTTSACSANRSTGDKSSKKSTGSGTVDAPEITSKKESELANKDYGGKTFKFLYWYEPDDYVKRKVAAFNKAHNANVVIEVKTGRYDTLAQSIASGQPYDIFAMHGIFYPQSIFLDIYEPLEKYISEADMFDSKNPDNGGLSKTVSDAFAWNGSYYALGSAKSVYTYVIYYNKKLFNEAGLEDPWKLYKDGKWTWDKFMEIAKSTTDPSNEKYGFHGIGNIYTWLSLNATSAVEVKDGKINEKMTDNTFLSAVNQYYDLYFGSEPITAVGLEGDPFTSGSIYMCMDYSDVYTMKAKYAKNSSAFGRSADNLGVVPVPISPLNTDKKYPAHAPQGYACAKGASDPSVAACYALFESRYLDEEVEGSYQMPVEVRKEIDKLFAVNGFLPFNGLQDSSGNTYEDIINRKIGDTIRGGADVTSTINNYRPIMQRLITDTLAQEKK